jgi:hypothetical protein
VPTTRSPTSLHILISFPLIFLRTADEPSRGAKIDEQIEAEEKAELERKGKA